MFGWAKKNQLLITMDTKQQEKQFIIFASYFLFVVALQKFVSLLNQIPSTYYRLRHIKIASY